MTTKAHTTSTPPSGFKNPPAPTQEQIRNFFSFFKHLVNTDQVMMETKSAPEDLTNNYNQAIMGNFDGFMEQARTNSTKHLIGKLFLRFITHVEKLEHKPLHVYISLCESGLDIWFVVNEDDELVTRSLILLEAQINQEYERLGLRISALYFDKGDRVDLPPNFQEWQFKKTA